MEKSTKKSIRSKIAEQLKKIFGEMEPTLGRSKFKRNIKKASKALAADFKEVKTKAEGKVKAKAASRKPSNVKADKKEMV